MITKNPLTRRVLLQNGALSATMVTALAAGGTSALAAAPSAAPNAGKNNSSDLEILNFALSLEHLEAAYYAQVLAAHSQHAYLLPPFLPVATSLAAIEASHVQTLQAAITAAGGTPVSAAKYSFPGNVFISTTAFAWFGWTLEEIGVGAYLGAIGKLKSRALRNAAASIYGSETRHAGILREMGGFDFAPHYFEVAYDANQVLDLIKPYVS